jgi:hypothetical protein
MEDIGTYMYFMPIRYIFTANWYIFTANWYIFWSFRILFRRFGLLKNFATLLADDVCGFSVQGILKFK